MAAKSDLPSEAAGGSSSPADPRSAYTSRLRECILKLQKAVEFRDEREVMRVQRRLPVLRKSCCPSVLRRTFVSVASPPVDRDGAESFFEHVQSMGLWSEDTVHLAGTSGDASATTNTEVDDTPVDEDMAEDDNSVEALLRRISRDETKAEALPHIQLYFAMLTSFLAIDTYRRALLKQADQAEVDRLLDLGCKVAWECPKFVKLSRRNAIDVLNAKAFFAMSELLTFAKKGPTLRSFFLEEYRTAALEHKQLSQATLINLLLQSYIDAHEFDLAIKFVLKTTFPEHVRSTAQVVRCLYNLGRIQAVRLEYSDAHEKLMTAVRKLPPSETFARGFKLAAYKHAIIVELLMGDVPDIAIFQEPSMKEPLAVYEMIVQAVRTGNFASFDAVLEQHATTFEKDGTLFLVERLHQSVIKAGLRRINNTYSRISLADIAHKLGITSTADAEGIVAKAIMDGVVTGVIDAEAQCLISKEMPDKYKTTEPAEVFHKRINFCSAMYKDAVKACI